MAKNCFCFSSPADKRLGCGNDANIARVFLNPSGFTATDQHDVGTKNPEKDVYTGNASLLFARP